MSLPSAPRFISISLRLAALYNLLWGLAGVLFPKAPLTLLLPLHRIDTLDSITFQFWQCIGMIVGVYGIGYWIAASDSRRHWPIVLVGLLGKILGPIGFLIAGSTGDLPWTFAITIIPNDLIWWVPFGAALLDARKAAVGGIRVSSSP